MDSEELKCAPAAFRRALGAGIEHLGNKITQFTYGGIGPDRKSATHIAGRLRPKFELATVAGDRRRFRETQLITFIEEQLLAIDACSDKNAVLFPGLAVT